LGANCGVGGLHFVGGCSNRGLVGSKRTLFFEPLLAAAVHDENLFVPVVLQLPKRPGREPVVVVAVENNGSFRRDPGVTEQYLKLGWLREIAANCVLQFGLPIPGNRTAHMALIVRS